LRSFIMACPPVDAVLLDLNLPDSEGMDTAIVVREIMPVPIVILTALDEPEMEIQAKELGIHWFSKPDVYGALNAVSAAILYREFGVVA